MKKKIKHRKYHDENPETDRFSEIKLYQLLATLT